MSVFAYSSPRRAPLLLAILGLGVVVGVALFVACGCLHPLGALVLHRYYRRPAIPA